LHAAYPVNFIQPTENRFPICVQRETFDPKKANRSWKLNAF